ncbi:dipeptide/oligopeptide/nickel ABC transporter ATP-binding protein [Syntrophotalea acetylenivorans]|uniref:Dipeptide/oligopeptide/nickel ABC transporter ATP-binding protein n=1 Tax=Syntrophotalea acetylenivorans TaxID=1842532 RepID=A0A1L3GNQ3_9BACT|nr:ABC transporter ATP-binding protein [Syntrophotalea acetylenivorans]APG27541.1 dipeptide/oligopeptide/nickel ABC transporter ATP-binding protein [Syntrophotalea acetylenivorans]
MSPLLDVRNLMTYFFTTAGLVKAVRGLEFSIDRGETLALVGESGCGKSVTALSLLRLVQPPGRVVEGELLFQGEDLRRLPPNEMRRVRGNRISMVFQEPMTALNPVLTIGEQIAEVLRLHRAASRQEALTGAADLLQQVGIGDPHLRLREYPHQLSGGMRQRVVIAMALACAPDLLIADEPTTALDVTIQAQILDLLEQLKEQQKMATLLITHDLGIVAETADKVAIMNAGLIMEYAPTATLFSRPTHPYTQGLLACIPRLGDKRHRLPIITNRSQSGETPVGQSFLDGLNPPFAPVRNKLPSLVEIEPNHFVRCWRD